MAKKGNRISFGLSCSVCKAQNYITQKNVINTKDKVAFLKFCSNCRKKVEHQEVKLK